MQTIQHPLTRTFLDSVLEQLDPDKSYGYWGTNRFQTILDDETNPTWRADVMLRPDEDHDVMDDGDWYGELAPVTYRHREYGDARPRHFDGRARKISFHRSCDTYWWQPPADVTDLDELRRCLVNLMENGYNVVILALKQKCSCCDNWDEVAYTSVGAVDLVNGDTADTFKEVVHALIETALYDMGLGGTL